MTTNAMPCPRSVSQDPWLAEGRKFPAHERKLAKHGDRMNANNMRLNPMFDPFAEAGYLRYSLRGIAHRQRHKTFRPLLEIRDYRYGTGELLYEYVFQGFYFDADAAIDCALGKGRQVIDDFMGLMSSKSGSTSKVPYAVLFVLA